MESCRLYLNDRASEEAIQEATVFIDDYTTGYGKDDPRVKDTILMAFRKYGIPLDPTYTGKAFMGMTEYLKDIRDKNVLFIHTGGTPLFWDIFK